MSVVVILSAPSLARLRFRPLRAFSAKIFQVNTQLVDLELAITVWTSDLIGRHHLAKILFQHLVSGQHNVVRSNQFSGHCFRSIRAVVDSHGQGVGCSKIFYFRLPLRQSNQWTHYQCTGSRRAVLFGQELLRHIVYGHFVLPIHFRRRPQCLLVSATLKIRRQRRVLGTRLTVLQ